MSSIPFLPPALVVPGSFHGATRIDHVIYDRNAELDLPGAPAIESRQQVVACDRLRDPRLPVAQVAVLAGFQDPSAFTRWFRTRTGEAPRAWRQRCAREAQAGP